MPEAVKGERAGKKNSEVDEETVRSLHVKGGCLDNIFIERLWWSLKYECVSLHACETGSQAKSGVGRWISFQDHQPPRAAQGGQPPALVSFDQIETDQQGQRAAQIIPQTVQGMGAGSLFLMASNKLLALDVQDTTNTEQMRERMTMPKHTCIDAGSDLEINIKYDARSKRRSAFETLDTMPREGLPQARALMERAAEEINGVLKDPIFGFKRANAGDVDTEIIARNMVETGDLDESDLEEMGLAPKIKPFKAELLQSAGIVHA